MTDAVAQCLPNLNKSVVLDVNAGFGVLTRALLNSGVNRIKSLEYREPCMTYLRVCISFYSLCTLSLLLLVDIHIKDIQHK